jgi:hypothetical protein
MNLGHLSEHYGVRWAAPQIIDLPQYFDRERPAGSSRHDIRIFAGSWMPGPSREAGRGASSSPRPTWSIRQPDVAFPHLRRSPLGRLGIGERRSGDVEELRRMMRAGADFVLSLDGRLDAINGTLRSDPPSRTATRTLLRAIDLAKAKASHRRSGARSDQLRLHGYAGLRRARPIVEILGHPATAADRRRQPGVTAASALRGLEIRNVLVVQVSPHAARGRPVCAVSKLGGPMAHAFNRRYRLARPRRRTRSRPKRCAQDSPLDWGVAADRPRSDPARPGATLARKEVGCRVSSAIVTTTTRGEAHIAPLAIADGDN